MYISVDYKVGVIISGESEGIWLKAGFEISKFPL
jgi:hypothetical protein